MQKLNWAMGKERERVGRGDTVQGDGREGEGNRG